MERHISAVAGAAFIAASLLVATPAAQAQPKATDKPLATRDLDLDGVVAEVIESARKEGVLTVRVRFRNTGDKPAKLLLVPSGGYDNNYLSAGDTKYTVIRDAKNYPVATPADGGGWIEQTLKPKGTWSWWAKFPAPPAERKSYTLYLNVGPPIEDVPIVDK